MGNNNADSYRKNIILIGNSDALRAHAEMIISKAKEQHPEKFEGNRDFFYFDLRYVAPFDMNFKELKRLQGIAAEAAGRRNEFRGYICMNLSAYITHEREDYFHKALYFLADMNEEWNYIFFVDNAKYKPARDLVAHMLNVFLCANIPCQVMEDREQESVRHTVKSVCTEQNADFDFAVEDLFHELIVQGICNENIVTALIRDVGWNCGPRITIGKLFDFLKNRVSVIKYMLTEKEYNSLVTFVEKWKECDYGEKEAV